LFNHEIVEEEGLLVYPSKPEPVRKANLTLPGSLAEAASAPIVKKITLRVSLRSISSFIATCDQGILTCSGVSFKKAEYLLWEMP
jgi:hypothetical protein